MECHVLLPEELMLRPLGGCSSPSVARLLEQQVGVVAKSTISKGSRFHPVQGTVRCGRLEVYSTLSQDDVSQISFSQKSHWSNLYSKKFSSDVRASAKMTAKLTLVN